MNRMDEAHGLLSGLLDTFATAQSLAVKWEGVVADPSTATYLREWLLLGPFEGHHLGPTAPNAGPIGRKSTRLHSRHGKLTRMPAYV